jgi:hypothetical protein
MMNQNAMMNPAAMMNQNGQMANYGMNPNQYLASSQYAPQAMQDASKSGFEAAIPPFGFVNFTAPDGGFRVFMPQQNYVDGDKPGPFGRRIIYHGNATNEDYIIGYNCAMGDGYANQNLEKVSNQWIKDTKTAGFETIRPLKNLVINGHPARIYIASSRIRHMQAMTLICATERKAICFNGIIATGGQVQNLEKFITSIWVE